MVWDGIDAVLIDGMDVGVGFVSFASGVVLDVGELVVEVIGVSYGMFVISAVPDFTGGLLACGEGVSAFDVLNAFCCGLVDGGRD
jgi:hypothetical protein